MLDRFFRSTVHHTFQNGRSVGDYVLFDLEDLLSGIDSKGEEVVVIIVAAMPLVCTTLKICGALQRACALA